MKAIFIGRWQPFHLGHLHAVNKLLEEGHKVTIIIGSSNFKRTDSNPLSFEERKELIGRVLGDKCEIIGIPDVFDDEEWIKSITDKVDFDLVVTGNGWTGKCFKMRGYKVKEPDLLEPETYNSSFIRASIKKGVDWEPLLPKEVVTYLKEKDLLKFI